MSGEFPETFKLSTSLSEINFTDIDFDQKWQIFPTSGMRDGKSLSFGSFHNSQKVVC